MSELETGSVGKRITNAALSGSCLFSLALPIKYSVFYDFK